MKPSQGKIKLSNRRQVCEKSCYVRQDVQEVASEPSHLKEDLNKEKDGAMKLSGKRVQG